MSDENKTLQDTVASVVSKPAAANKDTKPAETDKGMSQKTQSDETKAGETPDYVSGIDISDIPEQERAKFREKLALKAKLLEDGYMPKFQKVAQLEKVQKDLVEMGLDVNEAYDVLVKHIKHRANPKAATETKKEAVKTLDELIEKAPLEQRPHLEQMRKIILEETNVGELKKEVADLKTIIKEMQGDSTTAKQARANQFIDKLAEKYPQLVEKYRANMVDAHLRYRIPLNQVLKTVVPLEELEQAILSTKTEQKKPLTKEKKEAISSNPTGGITQPTEKIDIKSTSLKGVITSLLGLKK